MKENEKRPTQLFMRTTGGMGVTLEGSVDIESLPDDLARQIEANLTPTKLSRVARRKTALYMPGQQEYEITIPAGAQKSPKRYAFTDQQADPELLDLLDELTSIIIQEKIRARRARQQQQEAMSAEIEQMALEEEPAPLETPPAMPIFDQKENEEPPVVNDSKKS